MSEALAIAMAQKVALVLTAAVEAEAFSLEFAVSRAYVPRVDISEGEGDELQAIVAPARESLTARETRGTWGDRHRLDIAILKRVADDANATIDPLMRLVQEVRDFTGLHRLEYETGRFAALMEVANRPTYDQDKLDVEKVFFSLITLTYYADR